MREIATYDDEYKIQDGKELELLLKLVEHYNLFFVKK